MGNHVVDLDDLAVNGLADGSELRLNNLVNNGVGFLDEPVEPGVGHLDIDLAYGDGGVVNELPVNLVGRGGLEGELNSEACCVNGGGLEWNEVESIELSINKHLNVNSSKLNVDLVSTWQFLEDSSGEARCRDDMNFVKDELVEDAAAINQVNIKSLVVKAKIGCDWDDCLHYVVYRRRI